MGLVRSHDEPDISAALSLNEAAIVRSVLYASLFDYPLTLAQLRQTLVGSVQTATEIRSTYEGSDAVRALIDYQDGFFFARGRNDLIAERKRREARSRAFLARHGTFIRLACSMPFVEMVALSGSIAHLNLEDDGDLDLCIVTKAGHVWTTAVAVVLLAKLLRCRQTVCANFVLADSALKLEQQDLFTASQVLHLKPLSGDAVYRRLLAENPFVAAFYPNFHPVDNTSLRIRPRWIIERSKAVLEWLLTWSSAVVEPACRSAYGWYLRHRAAAWTSPEQVRLERDRLKLHTHSHRDSILTRYDLLVQSIVGDEEVDAAAPPVTPRRERPEGERPSSRERSEFFRRSPRSIQHRFSQRPQG
jgi:hypothetical protein